MTTETLTPGDRADGSAPAELRLDGPSAWTVALFSILAILFALLGVDGIRSESRTAESVLAAIGIAGAVILLVVVIGGLVRQRDWARPAALGFLALIAVAGAIQLVSQAAHQVTIPVTGIGAAIILWVWTRRPLAAGVTRPVTTRGGRRLAWALTIAYALVTIGWAPLMASVVRGTPLSVPSSAIAVQAALDCRALTAAALSPVPGPGPVSIPASLAWQWSEHEVLPGGTDSLAIRWNLTEADGTDADPGAIWLADAPGYHSSGGSTSLDAGGQFVVGLSRGSTTLADRLVDPAGSGAGSGVPVSIDVARQLLRDDRFEFVLGAAGPLPARGSLTVEGYYVHHDAWTANPAAATCSW